MTEQSPKGNAKSSLLVIVLDTNISQRFIRQKLSNFESIVDNVIAFGNSHLLQSSDNRLVILSCNHHNTEFLYPMPGQNFQTNDCDGQYEQFAAVEQTVKRRLAHIGTNAPIVSTPTDSLIAGSIAMALCYIARQQRENSPDVKLLARILVVTGSNECASQYMSYMNSFFTAQKLGVVLDVCSLDRPLNLLQQGCDITGGQLLRVQHLDGLMQYMLWVFLPDPETRKKLVLPPTTKVDYRAACFCHRQLIDIGYVCSVCLSVFCKFTPICTTCGCSFGVPEGLPGKPKKKKKNSMPSVGL